MCTKVNVSALLRALNPLKVHKFKVLAIKPILSQMMDEATYDGLMSNDVPFQEYAAINKLVSWLQHFTTQSIALQSQRKQHAILSPTQDPVAKKLKEKRDAAKVALLAPGEVDISQLYTSFDADLSNLPSKKRVIPSGSLQLAPFYSEVDNTLYKAPLLIALLAAFERKGTGRTKWKPRPPRSTKNVSDFEEEESKFDRLVVKVYDVTGSAEFQHTVIIREYVIWLAELDESYHDLAHKYFQPEDRDWWAENIIKILNVQPKPNNKLKISISKKAIEQIVSEGVASGVLPPKRIKPKPEPVLQKPAPAVVPPVAKKRDPLTSKLTKSPSVEHSSTVRAPVTSSTGARAKVLPDAPKSAPESKKPFSQPKLEPVKAPPAVAKAVSVKNDPPSQKAAPARLVSPPATKATVSAKPASSATSVKATATSVKTSSASNPFVSAKSLMKPVAAKSTKAAPSSSGNKVPEGSAVENVPKSTDEVTQENTVVVDTVEQDKSANDASAVVDSTAAQNAVSQAEKVEEIDETGVVEYDEDFASVDAAGDILAEVAIADSMEEANYAEDFDEPEPPSAKMETPPTAAEPAEAEMTGYEDEEFAAEDAATTQKDEPRSPDAAPEPAEEKQEPEVVPVERAEPGSSGISSLEGNTPSSGEATADANAEYGEEDFEPEPEVQVSAPEPSAPLLDPPVFEDEEDVISVQADAEPVQRESPQQDSMSVSTKEQSSSVPRETAAPVTPQPAPALSTVSESNKEEAPTGVVDGAEEYGEDFDENSAYTGGAKEAPIPAQPTVSIKEKDNQYYSDFEENSVGAASGVILDNQSVSPVDAAMNDPNRPLSAIEAAQREFDEIGEEDGVFFDSVDEEYI